MIDKNKLDGLFLKAKEAPHVSVFHETKEQFLAASSGNVDKATSKKDHFITFNKGIIMLIIAGAITLTFLFMPSDIENKKAQNTERANVELENKITEKKTSLKKESILSNLPNKRAEAPDPKKNIDLISSPILAPIKTKKEPLDNDVKKTPVKIDQKSDFVFPKLTEKEISENHKRKKKMLKALNKKDDKVYAYIPSSSFEYEGKPVSVQAFHMQRTEVSNIEYKTFLFDLLIQGKKSDFLIAKPKQELWTEVLGEDFQFMQDYYFSGGAYDDFPVNNITSKGAEMYCIWLTKEANMVNEEKGKVMINDLRIPHRTEWVMAATSIGKNNVYPWGESPVNEEGCFLSNFKLESFSGNLEDVNCKKDGDSTALTTAGYVAGLKMYTTFVKAYNPNYLGLWNMSGNVAEMVYESEDTENGLGKRATPIKIGTAGGGWMSTEEEVKLHSKDPHEGLNEEHLNVGFRVVTTHIGSIK